MLSHGQDGVVVLTLNAPEVRNACSPDMRREVVEQLQAASASPECRAIVVTGAGGHFCAGGRLPPNETPNPERTRANGEYLREIARLLHAGPKPTLAAVEGIAYGAGFGMAVACDYVVAGASARMCGAFGKVGLAADTGIGWTLPQRIGAARARDLLLTAREVRGAELLELGLVDAIVPDGEALTAALAASGRYAAIAPLALAAMKHMLGTSASLEDVLACEAEAQPRLTLSEDYAEGRNAMRERRAPVFRGR